MDRHIALTLVLLGSMQLSAATEQKELLIHFEKDSASLDAEATAELDAFLSVLPINGDYHFTVEGHTDSDGSFAFNDALADSRATTVQTYLVRHGADPALVDIGYRGERSPIASNANAVGMALNRRVRLLFTRNVFANVDELRQALREGSVQHFTVDPRRDTVLKGKAGSTVAFTASAFVTADGRPVSGPVTVELTEALGTLQMVAFGLSTRSDGRPLETDGMVQVLASDPSEAPLQLRSDAPMTVTMPSPAPKPRMQLFLSDSGTNWTLAAPDPAIIEQVEAYPSDPPPRPPVINIKLPVYKEDEHGKPLRPVQPVQPRVPTMLPEGYYARKDPWWSFMRPHVMQARSQKAQAQVEARNAASDKRYQSRLERYERENAAFPAEAKRYEARMVQWEEQKKQEKERWYTEVYVPAQERIESYAAPLAKKYQADLAAWKKKRGITLDRYAAWADSTRSTTVTSLTSYIFSTTQLGWVNCDRFYSVPEEHMQQVVAQMAQPGDAQAYLVFTSMRMLMRMEPDDQGELVSPPAPLEEPAVIFAFTVIDGRTQICMQPVRPDQTPVLKFKPSSVAEVGEKLAELAGT